MGKGGGGGGCWKFGCVAMLLMFVGGIGAAVMLSVRGRKQVEPKVERFFKNVEAGEFRAEYDAASSELKARESFGEFSNTLLTAYATLGPLSSRTSQGFSISRGDARSTVTATYDCTFDKGEAKVVFAYVAEEGEYRLLSVSFRSPQLLPRSTCPECGAPVKPSDKFCASCGEKLPPPPKNEPVAPALPTDPGGTVQEF